MNWLKKGPEIKLSELRMPRFLVDLYYDLDERHLIPVVVILIAGIVALPLLFGGSSNSDAGDAEAGVAAPPAVPGGTVVAAATPGLHNYRHRLGRGHGRDPFKSPYAAKSTSGGSAGGGAGAPATANDTSATTVEGPAAAPEAPPTTTSPSPPGPGPRPRGKGSGGGKGGDGAGSGASPGGHGSQPKRDSKPTYLSYTIDVRINPVSAAQSKPGGAKPYVRRGLPELTMLPSRDTPALTYMGPSGDAKKALLVVSSDVTSLFGDARCVLGSDSCQLLALEPGIPETIVFGANARTYRIQLLKLTPVESHGLDRAPLGKPKQKHGNASH